MQEVGAATPAQRTRPLRRGDLPRLAGRRSRIFPRRGRGHAGVAAARRQRLRLRPGVPAGRTDAHLRRDDGRGEARLEARPAQTALSHRARAFQKFAAREARDRHDRSSALAPGFGVYIHWPFCAAKCPYCDFNSHVRHQPVDQERFAAPSRRETRDDARADRPARGDQHLPRRRHAVADEAARRSAPCSTRWRRTGRCPPASR